MASHRPYRPSLGIDAAMKETMITDEIYSDYFQALLAGEKGKCIETVNGLLERGITPVSSVP